MSTRVWGPASGPTEAFMPSLRVVTDTPPRAIIYLRQSHYREESISLELQEIACRDYCDRMGYTVVGVEADPGISGRTWNRPAVQRVMQAVEDRATDVVVLWKWSRLSRSRKDWALAIDRADVAGGKIESATEPIDTATASGRFARGVMTEYAAFQSEQIGEQWEEVRQRRLKLGLPASGRLPYGWKWDDGKIVTDPGEADLVREMYRRYLSGDGGAAIAQWLNSQGVPAPNGGPWRRARPLSIMDSAIHAGFIPYRGAEHAGEHEPIIDMATWEQYRAERGGRRDSNAKPRTYAHLLSNLMRCTCGARMHGKGSVTGGKLYRGYLCGETLNGHAGPAYISALVVEPSVVGWFMEFDPDVDTSAEQTTSRARLDGVRREINALEAELATLTRQHTRGIVPEAAYLRAAADIENEASKLKASERRLAGAGRPAPTADDMLTLRAAWIAASIEERNRMLRRAIASITVRPDHFRIATTWGTSSEVSR